MNIVEPYTYYIYVPLLLLASVASLVLAAAAWRRRPTPGAKSLAAMMVAGAFWGLTYALELSFGEPAARALWGELKYLGIVIVPYMWLIFALRYTGRDKWLMAHRKRGLALLAAIPLVTAGVALTNGMHHLLRSYKDSPLPGELQEIVHGPWFWVHAGYSYLLLLAGTFVLLSTLLRRSGPYRGQWVAVAVGSLVPWAANVAYVLDAGVVKDLDPTPFGFTLTGGILLWGCLRSRLLDLVPVAHEAVVDEMADGLIVADMYGRVLDTNRAAQTLLGLYESTATGKKLDDLLPSLSTSSLVASFQSSQQTHQREDQEHQPTIKEGVVQEISFVEGQAESYYELEISPLHSGRGVPVEGIVILLRDITGRKRDEAAIAESQKRLSYQAFHDPLTGLPNRYLFESRLQEAPRRHQIDEPRKLGKPSAAHMGESEVEKDKIYVAILFMDLDGFKNVNDSLGHVAGDSLLRAVAERLEAGVRVQDTVARFGGDEFCVLLAGVSGTPEAVRITRRLQKSLQESFAIGTSMVRINASVGVAVGRLGSGDRGDRSLDKLVREADAAMYRAKKKGGALYEVVELDGEHARLGAPNPRDI